MKQNTLIKPLSKKLSEHIAPVVILLFALILRLWNLTGISLWLDEGLGIAFAKNPCLEMFYFLRIDVHPPLYYVLLKLLLTVSNSITWLRLFSVLCGTGGLAVFYFTFRNRISRKTVLWSLFLLAISPLAINQSHEIRMYGLLFLLANLTIWSALKFSEKPEAGPFIPLILFSLAMLYTHYISGIFLAGIIVFIGWGRFRDTEDPLQGVIDALKTGLLLAIGYLPWFPIFLEHFQTASLGGKHAQAHAANIPGTLVNYFIHFLGGTIPWVPFELILVFDTSPFYLGSIGWMILFGLFTGFFIAGLVSLIKEENRICLLTVSILGTTLILLTILLLMQSRFYPRAFGPFLPLIFLIIAYGITSIPRLPLRWIAGGYLAFCLAASSYHYMRLPRDPSLTLKKRLEYAAGENEPVIHTSQFSYFPVKAYLPEYEHYLLARPDLSLQERLVAGDDLLQSEDSLPEGDRLWLVMEYWGDPSRMDMDLKWFRYLTEKDQWNVTHATTFSLGAKKSYIYQFRKRR